LEYEELQTNLKALIIFCVLLCMKLPESDKNEYKPCAPSSAQIKAHRSHLFLLSLSSLLSFFSESQTNSRLGKFPIRLISNNYLHGFSWSASFQNQHDQRETQSIRTTKHVSKFGSWLFEPLLCGAPYATLPGSADRRIDNSSFPIPPGP
jgi:hypothetical protein